MNALRVMNLRHSSRHHSKQPTHFISSFALLFCVLFFIWFWMYLGHVSSACELHATGTARSLQRCTHWKMMRMNWMMAMSRLPKTMEPKFLVKARRREMHTMERRQQPQRPFFGAEPSSASAEPPTPATGLATPRLK